MPGGFGQPTEDRVQSGGMSSAFQRLGGTPEDFPQRSCRRCGETGHFARDCCSGALEDQMTAAKQAEDTRELTFSWNCEFHVVGPPL